MIPSNFIIGTCFCLGVFVVSLSDGTATGAATVSATGYLTPSAKTRLKQVFDASSKDLPSIHYSVLGYTFLDEPVPQIQDVCSKLSESAKELVSTVQFPPLETYFYITTTWSVLKKCSGALPTKDMAKVLSAALNEADVGSGSAGSTKKILVDLYHLVGSLANFNEGQEILHKQQSVDKIIKIVEATLKKDDSIPNVGYALHIAAWLGTKGQFAFDRIEDAIVQADEVDNKYLQFEGGLSITGLVVSGAYRLSEAVNKRPPLSGDHLVKFANYLLSRSSVQTPKGAATLLNAITLLANNKFEKVVVVTIQGDRSVSVEEGRGRLEVKVCDVLGRPLPESSIAQVVVDPAPQTSPSILPANTKFQQSNTDKTVYSIALVEGNKHPEPGIYKVSVSVVAAPAPKPSPTDANVPTMPTTITLVSNTGIQLNVKVMATIVPNNVQIGTGDADQTTQPKFFAVTYPGKLETVLEVDSLQKVVVKFSVKDKWTGKSIAVHQAFVRVSHQTTQQELIFVTDIDSTNNYRLDLDIGAKAQELGILSGVYKVELLIGDVIVANSISWHLADIKLKLMTPEPTGSSLPHHHVYTPKPEIKHLFREPEKRPPVFVSNLFTALVLLPLIILFGIWLKLGVNISNFPFSLSAIGFHLGLAGIFGLFGMFWLKLNMFETLKCLIGLGIVTFLCGNKMLAKIATNRSKH